MCAPRWLPLLLALSGCGAAVTAADAGGGADGDATAPLSGTEAALVGEWIWGGQAGSYSTAVVQLGFRVDHTAGGRVTVSQPSCGLTMIATSERTWRLDDTGVLVASGASCQVQNFAQPSCLPDPIDPCADIGDGRFQASIGDAGLSYGPIGGTVNTYQGM